MSVFRLRPCRWWFLCLVAGLAAGCGKTDAPATADGASATDSGSGGLPTAAIGGPKKAPAQTAAKPAVDPDDDEDDDDPDDEKDDKPEVVAPQTGTPEWLVHEATRLLLEPPPKTEDLEVLKKHRQDRNEKIIQLSQKAIGQLHNDKQKERLFNAAVHNLLEARLQMALTGDAESIELVYEDAAALFKRDPQSPAAAEGVHTLVNLAYSLAQNSTVDKARWIKEFGQQAQHFAEDFRNEERRSLPLLFAAARSCELSGMSDDALDCYSLIQKGFPKSPFAARVAPIVRRLKLTGKPAQVAGPTIDGDQVSTDDLLGRPVLVIFWSAEVKPFVEQLPQILSVTRKQSKRGLSIVGINLDVEAAAVQEFIAKNRIPWPQIFFPETKHRGWNNPLVVKYGIMDIPALWLIDQGGNVVSTSVKVEELAAETDRLLGAESTASAEGTRDSKPAARFADGNGQPTILERPGQRSSKKKPAAAE